MKDILRGREETESGEREVRGRWVGELEWILVTTSSLLISPANNKKGHCYAQSALSLPLAVAHQRTAAVVRMKDN